MGKKLPTNENIHIGEIYKTSFTSETEHSCAFYQVVGLRAKTLVELRAIRGECFVDETYDSHYKVRVRPLPGQFVEGAETFTVRAAGITEARVLGGETIKVLREINPESRMWPEVYYEVREGETGHLSGYAAGYALDDLRKEGKLPPCENKEK